MAELRAAPPPPHAAPVDADGVAFAVLPHHGRLMVHGRDADPALTQAVARALGFAPPETPNTVTSAGARRALWLSPGTWRIVGGPDDAAARLETALREAVPRALASVVDVSDSYTVIQIRGAGARAALARGCPLDLHARAFGAGRCARSLLVHNDVLLHQCDDAPSFDVEVRRSVAPYVWSWLTGAPIDSSGLLRGDHTIL